MIELPQATEVLARRLADARRLPVEEAIREALEDHARASGVLVATGRVRDASPEAVARRQARFDAATDRIAAMPARDRRSPGEIMDDLNEL